MPAIVNAANCSVAAEPGGLFVVTKTGGDPAAADASAVSDQTIAGDFVLRIRSLGDFLGYFGVSANPLAGVGFSSIDRAVQLSGGSCRCYDNGLFRPPLFSPGAGFVWLRRLGSTLQYLHGADLAAATLVRSVAGVAAPMGFDSSIVRPGVGLEVKFEAPAPAGRKQRRLTLALGL
jgi:hypothetical protein